MRNIRIAVSHMIEAEGGISGGDTYLITFLSTLQKMVLPGLQGPIDPIHIIVTAHKTNSPFEDYISAVQAGMAAAAAYNSRKECGGNCGLQEA